MNQIIILGIPEMGDSLMNFILSSISWEKDADGYYIMPEPQKTQNKKYAWLFNNLYKSINNGGNKEENNKYLNASGSNTNNINGYWTSTPEIKDTKYAWYVDGTGMLFSNNVNTESEYGVRPVISF